MLPPPGGSATPSFDEVLRRRRSTREYSGAPLSPLAVSRLLWAGQGISGPGLRTAPSAGGSFFLGLTLVAGDVADVPAGSYRYEPDAHRLVPLARGDLRAQISDAGIGDQPWLSSCAALILISGDETAARVKFADQPPGTRGVGYVHLEAGAAAQNMALQAAADGVGAVLVAGFDDDALRQHCPEGHEPLALLALGHLRDR
ncbi:SagB/ThcOx family dehydrogenase [Saccharopolyspora shandongensis]|uniref:SagB/ThcOx family dehydrogenase n=1 Tax=Saccharopolyspora shandongensis TaxID=418495 RepID=UPI00340DBD0C